MKTPVHLRSCKRQPIPQRQNVRTKNITRVVREAVDEAINSLNSLIESEHRAWGYTHKEWRRMQAWLNRLERFKQLRRYLDLAKKSRLRLGWNADDRRDSRH